MTDQLRDLLVEAADEARVPRLDPTTWSRARRARRRREASTAVGAGVVALVLVVAAAVLTDRGEGTGPPTDRTDRSGQEHGIPRTVRGVNGRGGLPPEPDLALGRASVAIANPSGAFVVTAADGTTRRLDLPGYDPGVYDDPDVRRTGMVGLSLSPDGTRLAYGWHAALPAETGQQHGPVPSGLRILDLLTGRVADVPEDRVPPAEFGAGIENQGFPWGLVAYGPRWSGDSRFLGYDLVWAAVAPPGRTVDHWGDELTDAYHDAGLAYGRSVYDTATGTRLDIVRSRWDSRRAWLAERESWTGWPSMVGADGELAHATVNDELVVGVDGRRVVRLQRPIASPPRFAGGLFDGSGVLVERAGLSTDLLSVGLRPRTVRHLRLDTGPAHLVLLGWIGPRQVLVEVHPADGPRAWQEDADLRVLDLSGSDVTSRRVGHVRAAGTASTFSFATDFATPERATVVYAGNEATGDQAAGGRASPEGAGAVDSRWWTAGGGTALLVTVLTAALLRRRLRAGP